VLISTYASLIAEARDCDARGNKKTRFDQMTRWFGRGQRVDASGRPEGNRKEYGGMVRWFDYNQDEYKELKQIMASE